MAVKVRVLGPLEIVAGGVPVPIRRGRPRRLLLALLVRHGQAVSTDTLIEDLWGDAPPRNAINALQILVSYLRKQLATAGDGAPAIETLENRYRIVVDPAAVDAFVFEDAVRSLPAAPAERLRAADAALALWRGEPYAEAAYESFAQGDIRRLTELRVTALEERVQALLDLGRHADAVGDLRGLVAEYPLHERFHAQLVLALYRCGRQADALRAYDAARSVLVDELGLDPGPELQAVAQAVREQSASLDWQPVAEEVEPSHAAEAADEAEGPAPPGPPAPTGSLVGRDDEVAQVVRLLGDRRVVTLTGPGGAGKTRVALAAVERLRDDGRSVWWADLAGAASEDDVLAAAAAAVGAATQPDDTGESLVAHLSRRSGVLVLDTCEHVVAAVRRLAGRVRRECAGVAVLSTSRQPLRIADELAWPLPPLSLPPSASSDVDAVAASAAVRLFVDRAAAVRPGFELTPANAADVARIVLLLDGLPLAIELAAAHADALTPAKLAELLADRLRVLDALRATMDWSYELLDPDEARFFERLSVFAGPFPLEAAVTVAGEGLSRDGVDLLVALTRQSLVVAGDDRFRLLDTVRAYAAEQLRGRGAEEVTAARRRHASWYADWAVEADRHLRGPDAVGWASDLRADLPNLGAALEYSFSAPGGDPHTGARLAAALAWFWSIEGLFGEAARWLAAALGVVPPETPLAADVLASAGIHESSLGDLAAAIASCTAAIKLYEQHGDEVGLAKALTFLGISQWGLGHHADAAASHDRAIELCRAQRDHWGLGLALVVRARTAADAGDDALALRLLDSALPVVRRGGDPGIIALCMEQRARAAVREGDFSLAAELAAESVELQERIGYAEGVVAGQYALGQALAGAGDVAGARRRVVKGLGVAVELDHPGGMAEGLELLAALAARDGDSVEAARLVAAADAVRERADLPRLRTHEVVVGPALAAAASLDEAGMRAARTAGRVMDVALFAREQAESGSTGG